MTGYTRADSVNNIADGNIINASDLDGEFDAVQAAFNSTTGHVHDGTAANGAPITKIGPTQDVVASAIALLPKTTATVDVGSSSLKFKDFFFSGTGTLVGLTYTGTLTGSTGVIAIGTNQIYKDSSGNVGIGTASPSYKLDVAGVVRGTGNIISGDGSAFVFGTGVTSYVSGSSTSNVIDFYTSSTARMRIDSSGNVGIGTSAPGYKLDVQGATASTQLKSTTGTNYVAHFLNNTGGFTYLGVESSAGGSLFTGTAAYEAVFGTVSAYPVGFATGGAERMRIDSSGNVGIGTASPAQKLDVVGSGKATSSFAVGDSSGNFSGSMLNESDVSKSITFNADPANVGTNSFMRWNVDGTERMRIDSSGNVGIGTSSPVAKLQIKTQTNGNAAFQNSTSVAGGVKINCFNDAGSASSPFEIDGSTLQFNIASTEKMRIDSSGNVGIGTSSPASKLNVVGGNVTVDAGKGIAYSGDQTRIFTPEDNVSGGLLQWGNGILRFNSTAANERMRIDSSGNVGIGTSSPAYPLDVYSAANGIVRVKGGSGTSQGAAFYVTAAGSGNTLMAMGDSARIIGGTVDTTAMVYANVSLVFHVNNAESMRIDSSGNLLVGATINAGVGLSLAKPDTSGCQSYFSGSAGGYHWRFGANNTGAVGSISTSGSTTTFSTSSDYRLKHDITPMTGALDRVASLKPVTYKWNADNSDGEGFIAHELQAVIPDCVVGEKDAVDADGNPAYQGIDTSFLVATLTAAIQEQQALITSLTARIAALEAA